MKSILWICILLWTLVDGAKILTVFTLPLFSHQNSLLSISTALSLKGHNVTAITTNPLKDKTLTNLTEIDISHLYGLLKNSEFSKMLSTDNYFLEVVISFRKMSLKNAEAIFQTEAVMKLIGSEEKYDLVMVEAYDPIFFSFGWRFKAPIVVISTSVVLLDIHDAMGNPTHPIFTPEIIMEYHGALDVPFRAKVYSFLYSFVYRAIYYWYFLPQLDELARKYLGDNMPYLGEIQSNICMMFINSNPITDTIRPKVPNVVEVEQIHIREPKPLTQDLKDYLDSSKNGAVYFSLGTNVLSSKLNNKTLDAIVTALGSLPYRVLWKYENNELPIQLKNVLIRKWFPQQDVLGHPNIKVFVTQGGIHSVEEAITHGIPMVGIPFMSDQPKNVNNLVKLGAAIRLNHKDLTAETLRNAILQVAKNKSYKTNILKAKNILEDQPMRGIEKIIWWTEYVIRHNGTSHLRYAGADIRWYQYFMVDVISFTISILFGITYFIIKSVVLLKDRIIRDVKSKIE